MAVGDAREPGAGEGAAEALRTDPARPGCRTPRVIRCMLMPALAVAVAASGGAAHGGGTPVALVTAETENALLAVSLPSGHVLRRVAMPADPENVAIVGDRYAVVVSPRAAAVTVVSLPSLRVVRVLRGFVDPHLAAPTADGRGAYVTDDGRGQPVSALFAAVYAMTCGMPISDAIDAMNRIDPRFASIIDGAIARVRANAPVTCVSKTLRNSSSVVSVAHFFK